MSESWADPSQRRSKKELVVLLRWVLVIASSYLILVSAHDEFGRVTAQLIVPCLLLSNFLIQLLPPRVFEWKYFDHSLLLTDLAVISGAIWIAGPPSGDFYLLYFLVIILAAVGETLHTIVFSAIMVSAVYIGINLFVGGSRAVLTSEVLIRVPFFFVVAVFYGYFAQRVRRERSLRMSQLVEALKIKNDFLAHISHEVRTPLTSVISFAEMLKNGTFGPVPKPQVSIINRILTNAWDLIRIVDDILVLSSIDSGRLEQQNAEGNIDDLLREAEDKAEAELVDKPVAFSAERRQHIPPLLTNWTALRSIVSKLVSNATKFTADGEIRLEASYLPEKQVLSLCVRDTGIGIPMDRVEEIFEPFRQLDEGLTRRYGGAGLGLAIARKQAELLGGKIEVHSAPERGSAFTLTIPVIPVENKKGTVTQIRSVSDPIKPAAGVDLH